MAMQFLHPQSVNKAKRAMLDDLVGFHRGKPSSSGGVRGDKVPPRRYEKTTYLQKADARPPQRRKVMGLQRAATGDGPRLYEPRTASNPTQRWDLGNFDRPEDADQRTLTRGRRPEDADQG